MVNPGSGHRQPVCSDMSLSPIAHNGAETLSFRQIDALNGFDKGTAFRLFKQWRAELIEGQHYFYLSTASHANLIDALRRDGRIYRTTGHLVLITRSGYERMQQLGTMAATAGCTETARVDSQ